MGCNASKLEPEETPPPVGLGPVQRKIDEFKRNRLMRRRTTRKDSIVSTTELLIRSEDVDDGLASSEGSLRKPEMSPSKEEENKADETKKKQHNGLSGHQEHEKEKEEEEEEDKKEDVKEELQVVTNEKGRRLLEDDDDDEDLPGSPSFRVYFMDDSPSINEGDQSGAISEKDTLGSKASSEGNENKPPRKGRARRLRAFAAKPISYGLRSCYSNHRTSISLDDKTPLSKTKPATTSARPASA